jgi:hypothetical protein
MSERQQIFNDLKIVWLSEKNQFVKKSRDRQKTTMKNFSGSLHIIRETQNNLKFVGYP